MIVIWIQKRGIVASNEDIYNDIQPRRMVGTAKTIFLLSQIQIRYNLIQNKYKINVFKLQKNISKRQVFYVIAKFVRSREFERPARRETGRVIVGNPNTFIFKETSLFRMHNTEVPNITLSTNLSSLNLSHFVICIALQQTVYIIARISLSFKCNASKTSKFTSNSLRTVDAGHPACRRLENHLAR